MPRHRDVFDADEVQLQTRRQAAQVSVAAMAAVVLTGLWIILGHRQVVAWPLASGGLCATWALAVIWAARRLRRLRRVVWCVKLTEQGVTGYDYARRPISLAWNEVRRVDLTDGALRIVRSRHCVLHVSHQFDGFEALARRAIAEAEQAGAAIWLDGQPLRDVPLDTLRALVSDPPGSAHGRTA